MARKFGKSLAFQKFIKTIESQIRSYWQIQTSLIYAKRWWDSIHESNIPLTIAKYPGDEGRPFSSIDIKPSEYVANFENVQTMNRENIIVNLITAFEVYMFDVVKRIYYLNPKTLEASEMPFEARDIATALGNSNVREWFAQRVTEKNLRNLTHLKMLMKIQGLVKCDLKNSHPDKLNNWNQWTFVRNALVHNGREVSEDLSNIWQEKFHRVGEIVKLSDRDFIAVHGLALELAKIIDEKAMQNHIQTHDATLLIREFFVKDGIKENKELSKLLYSILNIKIKHHEVDQAISYQKKTNALVEGWKFSHFNFLP